MQQNRKEISKVVRKTNAVLEIIVMKAPRK